MKYLLTLFLLLITVFSHSQPAQKKLEVQSGKYQVDSASKVRWLKKNIIPIRSIDSADEDFTDLQPLKKMIGNARVVSLGEQTHVDGATYLGKTRLIKFLHREMGFDVVMFESGFYDVARAWQNMKQGMDPRNAMIESVFFAERNEYKPLAEYLGRRLQSGRPLEIAGFDDQITGTIGRDSLVHDLRRFCERIGYKTVYLHDTAAFAKQLVTLSGHEGYKSPTNNFYKIYTEIQKVVDSLTRGVSDYETLYFKQLIKSIRKAAEHTQITNIYRNFSGEDNLRVSFFSVNMRDEQMADNVLWYLKNNPQKKIILWGHLFHTASSDVVVNEMAVSKNRVGLWRDSAKLLKIKVMGEYLKEKLGDSLYNIAFTAYTGRIGVIVNGKGSGGGFKENQRPDAELEELINATGLEYAFLDIRKPAKGGEWLKKPIIARPLLNRAIEAEWHKAVDGFFYIRKMFPNTLTR